MTDEFERERKAADDHQGGETFSASKENFTADLDDEIPF